MISDIHGNLEAFLQVLADMDEQGVDAVMCLGDNVGYGPEPEPVLELLRRRRIPSVMGNHELVLAQPRYLRIMNPSARKSITITRTLLSDDTMAYIQALEPSMVSRGALFVHGCPPDSMTKYLFAVSDASLRRAVSAAKAPMCFVGHTHDLEIIRFEQERVDRSPLGRGRVCLDQGVRYIINVGSVGQPRDGNNNAKYVIWDQAAHAVEVRFVPYDIARTADRILALGFPEYDAIRLW